MIKVLIVFGTRPEAIKLFPVIQEMKNRGQEICGSVCVTAQHREMLDPLLDLFKINVKYDLDIIQENQTLEHITSSVLNKLGDVIRGEKPDYVLVQGDTTTAMAACLSAFYNQIKIGHVEAGLRTLDKYRPYPEEMNRRIIDCMSDICFAHTEHARQNLLSEGISPERIKVTGNTVIDALLEVSSKTLEFNKDYLEVSVLDGRKMILVTAHRRENFGQPMVNICRAIKEIARLYSDDLYFIIPVHLNPNVRKIVFSQLSGIENISLIDPLDYESFVHLMKRTYLILTDSGGLQEEAPSLGKPVLLLRDVTERPEAVEAGAVKIVGTQTEEILKSTIRILDDRQAYDRMAEAGNPFGDGKASQRIVACLINEGP